MMKTRMESEAAMLSRMVLCSLGVLIKLLRVLHSRVSVCRHTAEV